MVTDGIEAVPPAERRPRDKPPFSSLPLVLNEPDGALRGRPLNGRGEDLTCRSPREESLKILDIIIPMTYLKDMTTTQTSAPKAATRDAAMAKLKASTAQQSTATLCEAIVILAALPRTPETNLTRAVMTDVLCERHPAAMAAAEAWVDSDDEIDIDAVVADAALAAIGA